LSAAAADLAGDSVRDSAVRWLLESAEFVPDSWTGLAEPEPEGQRELVEELGPSVEKLGLLVERHGL